MVDHVTGKATAYCHKIINVSFCYGKMSSLAICNKKFVNSREYSVHFLVLRLLYGLNHPLRWSYSFSASVLAETKAKIDTEKRKKRSNITQLYSYYVVLRFITEV